MPMNQKIIPLSILAFLLMVAAQLPLNRCAVYKIALPEGDLEWSTTRPVDAKMCVPAAFSDENDKVVGQYRIDGVTHQDKTYRMRVSLKGNSFIVDETWHSDNGFQQFALVNNGVVMKFNRDSRRFCRRALCKKNGKTFLVESYLPVTLNEFAKECGKIATEAVNLDMGSYGYGYIKEGGITRPLYIWGYDSRDKQTNWLYIK